MLCRSSTKLVRHFIPIESRICDWKFPESDKLILLRPHSNNMSEIEFHFGDENGELSGDSLEEVRNGTYRQESQEFLDYVDSSGLGIDPDMAFYQEDDILNAALVAAGEKNGFMLRATLRNREPLQNQIEAMNSMGLDCFVVPETIDVEGEAMDNSAVYVTNNHEYRDASEGDLPFTIEEEYGLDFTDLV